MALKYHKLCVVIGLLALAHAGYSAAQHRAYLRLTEGHFTRLPLDMILQCVFGLLLACYGVVNVTGSFKEIKASADFRKKTWDMVNNRQSFYVFNHRGNALCGRPQHQIRS